MAMPTWLVKFFYTPGGPFHIVDAGQGYFIYNRWMGGRRVCTGMYNYNAGVSRHMGCKEF